MENMYMKSVRKNNHGFSLIELLVAVVIGGIIIAGIGSIMVVSSKSFASTSAEAGMQSSAQIVMDHIQDVAIDANQKVEYAYTDAPTPTGDTWKGVVKDSDIASPGSVTHKKLSVYNFDANDPDRNRHYDFIWVSDNTIPDGERSYITYSEYRLGPDLSDLGQIGDTEKLAENVVSFKCDLTDIESKRILYVEMDFKKGTKEYHAANNISLRNKVGTSVSVGSLSNNVTVKTIDLSAEPGMKYPVAAGAKAVATGNVSNKLTFEVEGESGSKETAAGSRILAGTSTLEISRTEQLDKIPVAAVDELGGRHTFNVYINRVLWTDDMPGGRGIDIENGIQINGSDIKEDTVNAGNSKAYSVTIKSNPGYNGTDRTATAPYVSGNIISVTGDDKDKISFVTTPGTHTYTLNIPTTVKKGTVIKLRFTASHSLAGGGLPSRDTAYPGDDGVYKDLKVTVGSAGVEGIDGVLLRGQLRDGSNEINPEDMLNDPGQEELKKLFTDGTGVRWLLWRPYRHRPATDGNGFNVSYADNKTGWGDPVNSDTEPEGTKISDFTGWHKISGGYRITLGGTEFNCLSPANDTQIQFFCVKTADKSANSTVLGQTTMVTTTMYGLRTEMSRDDQNTTEKGIDIGTVYALDSTNYNRFYDNQNYYKVWQKQNSLQSLRHINSSSGGATISMKYVYSKTLGSGGQDLTTPTLYDSDEEYVTGGPFYKSAYTQFPGNFWVNNRSKFSVSDDPYYIWPQFTYTTGSHAEAGDGASRSEVLNRPSSHLKFYYKDGNITLKGVNGADREGFVPYPAYTKDGFTYSKHSDFYGNSVTSWEEGTYYDVGTKYIKYRNGGGEETKDYRCSICYKDNTYYLKFKGVAVYKYNVTSERWEYERSDEFKANLSSGINGSDKDIYLPGPDDDEFYTGFKNIQNESETKRQLASNMSIYYVKDGVSDITDYKIAYFRKDNKYYVDIYTLNINWNNRELYKRYYYDTASKLWVQEGNIFSANINFTVVYNAYYKVDYSFYLPTRTDTIDWYNKFDNTDNYYRVADGIVLYKIDGTSISRYENNTWSNPLVRYARGGNQPFVLFEMDDNRYIEYYYSSGKWNKYKSSGIE